MLTNLERLFFTDASEAHSEVPVVTTQLPDAYDDDISTEEAPVTNAKDNETKLRGTSDDTTTKPSDTTTSNVNNSIEDPSNARCQGLIKEFEANEEQLKKYYKNGHATKVFVFFNAQKTRRIKKLCYINYENTILL